MLGLSALVLLGSSLAAPLARAESEALRQAKQHFQSAEVQYRLRNFAQALAEYQTALKLSYRPSIILNIAQCHRQLGEADKAVFYYKLYLSDWKRDHEGEPPPYAEEVERYIEELTGEIERARERKTKEQRAEEERARRDREREAALALASRPAAGAPSGPGRLYLHGLLSGARVRIDGALRPEAELEGPLEVAAGSHVLEVSRFGFSSWSKRIKVLPERELEEQVQLRRTRLWLFAAIAALTLGAGAEAAAIACTLQAREQYQDTPEWRSWRNGALAGHLVAGTLAAAAVASFVVHYQLGRLERRGAVLRAGTIIPTSGGAFASGSLEF